MRGDRRIEAWLEMCRGIETAEVASGMNAATAIAAVEAAPTEIHSRHTTAKPASRFGKLGCDECGGKKSAE